MASNDDLLWARDFLASSFETYFARLPRTEREGLDWYTLAPPYTTDFAYLVTDKERDGTTDRTGRVCWRQVSFPEGRQDSAIWAFAWTDQNPLLAAYGTYFSMFRMLLRDSQSSILLAATPLVAPGFELQRLRRMMSPRYLPELRPIGQTADGSQFVCADLRGSPANAGQDCPVVSVSREEAFRWRVGQPLQVTRLFGSVRKMFEHYAPRTGESGEGRFPFARQAAGAFARYDWEPWLAPELDPTDLAPDQSNAEVDMQALAGHLDRLRRKIEILRAADPAYLIWDSGYHQYQPNPPLTSAERFRFETASGIRLPEVYAQFLMTLGNGGVGIGPWGLPRVEAHSDWQAFRADPSGFDPSAGHRLSTPFPLRAATQPHWPDESTYREEATFYSAAPDLIHGSVPIGTIERNGSEGSYSRTFRLVITGAECGHVWVDETFARRGIYPVVRRGPYSFLAWYEGLIDDMLAAVDVLYDPDAIPAGTVGYPPTSAYRAEFGM